MKQVAAKKKQVDQQQAQKTQREHGYSHRQDFVRQGHDLHGTIGNHGVLQRFGNAIIQAKLQVGEPNDKYEREAERVADMIVKTAKHGYADQIPNKNRAPIQMKTNPSSGAQSVDIADCFSSTISLGHGQPINKSTREKMESRFGGQDFSGVRICTSARAAEITSMLGARAFTVGRDIGFAKGRYAPGEKTSDRLLAHELAHVVQQRTISSGLPSLLQRKTEERSRQPETPLAMEYAEKECELLGEKTAFLPAGVREAILLANVEIGFISGFFEGLKRKSDLQDFNDFTSGFTDITNVVQFDAGTRVGVLVGVTGSLKDYLVGFYDLGKLLVEAVEKIPTTYKVAFAINPLLAIPLIEAKELYDFLTNPEEKESVKKVAKTVFKAFMEFEEYLRKNPNALVAEGEDLGTIVGEYAGEYLENMVFTEASYFNKGVAVGNVIGYVALEIVFLVIAPEAVAAKGVATGARAAATMIKGSRFATRILKIIDSIPGLRKLLEVIRNAVRAGKGGGGATKGLHAVPQEAPPSPMKAKELHTVEVPEEKAAKPSVPTELTDEVKLIRRYQDFTERVNSYNNLCLETSDINRRVREMYNLAEDSPEYIGIRLDADHIIESRLFEHYKPEFAALNIKSSGDMPAIAQITEYHIRKPKNLGKVFDLKPDAIPDVPSLTKQKMDLISTTNIRANYPTLLSVVERYENFYKTTKHWSRVEKWFQTFKAEVAAKGL